MAMQPLLSMLIYGTWHQPQALGWELTTDIYLSPRQTQSRQKQGYCKGRSPFTKELARSKVMPQFLGSQFHEVQVKTDASLEDGGGNRGGESGLVSILLQR